MADTALPPSLPPKPEDLTRSYVPLAEEFVVGDHPTANPDGVTVSNVDYTPKTQEEKAELLHVEMVQPVEVAAEEPYPTGHPQDWEQRAAMLRRIHPPMDLVPADERTDMQVAALRAGGAVPPAEIKNEHLEADHGRAAV